MAQANRQTRIHLTSLWRFQKSEWFAEEPDSQWNFDRIALRISNAEQLIHCQKACTVVFDALLTAARLHYYDPWL